MTIATTTYCTQEFYSFIFGDSMHTLHQREKTLTQLDYLSKSTPIRHIEHKNVTNWSLFGILWINLDWNMKPGEGV